MVNPQKKPQPATGLTPQPGAPLPADNDSEEPGTDERRRPWTASPKVGLRYCFTVDAPLRVPEPVHLAKGPGGTRVNVVYGQGAKVETDLTRLQASWATDPDAPGWSGLSGDIVSGGDFYLVRTDGVLELDGRATIATIEGVIIEATYKGLVDLYSAAEAVRVPRKAVKDALAKALPSDPPAQATVGAFATALRAAFNNQPIPESTLDSLSASIGDALPNTRAAQEGAVKALGAKAVEPVKKSLHEALGLGGNKKGIDDLETAITRNYRNNEFVAYEDFLGGRQGALGKGPVQVHFPVSFQTSSAPWTDSPDEDMSWVAKHYVAHRTTFWKYRRLVRNSYIAIGTLTFEPKGIGNIPLAKRLVVDVFEIDGSSLEPAFDEGERK